MNQAVTIQRESRIPPGHMGVFGINLWIGAEVLMIVGMKVHSPPTRFAPRARSKNAVKNFVSSSVERPSE